MDINTNDPIEKYWSLSPQPLRDQQPEIFEELIEAIDDGYRYIILDAGTGIGKSAIATTIANMAEDTYICTTTTQLQTQYYHDFDSMLKEIKGRRHYKCLNGDDCSKCYCKKRVNKYNILSEKRRILSLNPSWEWYDLPENEYNKILSKLKVYCHDCPYTTAKKEAISAKTMLSNYHFIYYLGNYANQLATRDLLVLDEAHNIEQTIMNIISDNLNRTWIYDEYDFDIFYGIDETNYNMLQSIEYWQNILSRIIDRINNEKNTQIKLYMELGTPVEELTEIVSEYNADIKKYESIQEMLNDGNWCITPPEIEDILNDTIYGDELTVLFEPITINQYTERLFKFGDTVIFLTATLPSKRKFCKWMGLEYDEVKVIHAKSPFSVENRPIYLKNIKKMSGGNWEDIETIRAIEDIIRKHYTEKGVIHTSSDDQAWWIYEHISDYIKTFVVAKPKKGFYNQSYNRDKIIKDFENCKEPCICIGAGIKEGVDFKHDKCRYNIIFKLPYLYPTAQVQARMNLERDWYFIRCIVSLEQAYGRGIRDITDYCDTYILDSGINTLLNYNKKYFDEYFTEAIRNPHKVIRIPRG